MTKTDVLAFYAAALSTAIALWNLKRARPVLRVALWHGIEDVDEEPTTGLYVLSENWSSHPVYLANVSLLIPYETASLRKRVFEALKYRRIPRTGWIYSSLSNYGIEDGCPRRLEPWDSHRVFIPGTVVSDISKTWIRSELKAVVQDKLGRRSYSPKLVVDLFDES